MKFLQSCLVLPNKTMQAYGVFFFNRIQTFVKASRSPSQLLEKQWNLRRIRDAFFSPDWYSNKISFPQSVRIPRTTCVKDDSNKWCGSRGHCTKFLASGPCFMCAWPPSVWLPWANPAPRLLNKTSTFLDGPEQKALLKVGSVRISMPVFTPYISALRNNAFPPFSRKEGNPVTDRIIQHPAFADSTDHAWPHIKPTQRRTESCRNWFHFWKKKKERKRLGCEYKSN